MGIGRAGAQPRAVRPGFRSPAERCKRLAGRVLPGSEFRPAVSRITRSARNTLSSDWYGTSRLLASALSSDNRPVGSRKEIVSVDGFRLGNTATRAWLQSRNRLVSCVSQNSRSSASDANGGTGLSLSCLVIGLLFPYNANSPHH